MKTAIIIPARYTSTRLPGKPLIMIQGRTLLQRVVEIALEASARLEHISVLVATDDDRIIRHCAEIGVASVMTSADAQSGTDRVAEAMHYLKERPDFILNLQGDAPFTPPYFLRAMIDSFSNSPCDVITPITQMSWQQLDDFRHHKNTTPFSGTTVTFNEVTGQAFWFSKTIIPAIRGEEKCRVENIKSPVFRHIGLYGYSHTMLERYTHLPESRYEKLEGLEQLRILENGYTIRCVPVDYKDLASMSGIDSPEDVARAEKLLRGKGV